jgi:tetratricopeptide (TPR) repeat protein
MENYKDAIPCLRDAVTFTPRVKEALVELIDALYQTGNLKEAREWTEVGEKEGIQPARIQFLKGMILIKEGKYMEAVTAFEKAKEMDKTMSQAAEFQIANAYTREGKLKEAQKRFQSTISLDPNTDLATYARDYDKMVAEKIARERSWRFSMGMNYKFDTNVVAKGSGPQVDAISGVQDSALNMSARVGYTAPFSFKKPYNLSFQYSLFAEKYFPKQYIRADGTKGDISEYNSMTNVISAIPGYNFQRWSLTLPISYTYNDLQGDKNNDFLGEFTWLNTSRYMDQIGLNPTARYMVSQNSVGEVSFGFAKKSYFATALHPEPISSDEDRDSKTMSGSLGWTYFFQEGKGLLGLRFTHTEEDAEGRNWTNDANGLSLSLLYPLKDMVKMPLSFQFSGDATYTGYKYANVVFDTKRQDDIYNTTAGFIYGLTEDVDILAQYSYIRDKCNISIYDYKREIFSLGFEYRY